MRVGTIEALLRLPRFIDFGARADGDDMIADNGDGSIFDHAALGVHGDDVARAPDPIGGRGVERCGGGEEQLTGKTHQMASGTDL